MKKPEKMDKKPEKRLKKSGRRGANKVDRNVFLKKGYNKVDIKLSNKLSKEVHKEIKGDQG